MWRSLLSHRKAHLFIALIGMLLVLPTINVGLIGDDFLFRELITGLMPRDQPAVPFGLYTFADGQPSTAQALRDVGHYPWWAYDHVKLMFWRPLAEMSHWLDYLLWPESPMLMHVHQVLWYGLLVALLARFYRMLEPDPVRAGLGALIFAASSVHLLPIVWLAARNQLMAASFILVTLMLYHQWRQGKGLLHGLAAMATLALGLLCGEGAIAGMAYLTAYALMYEQGRPWMARLKPLLPFMAIVVVWRLAYSMLGYGSVASGGYIDPGADPLRFLESMVIRMPTFLMAQLYGIPTSLLHTQPFEIHKFYALGALSLVALAVWAGHVFRLWSTPVARFYGLGAVLALVPSCAAEPNDRLILNAEIGLSALLAMLFVRVFTRRHHDTGRSAVAGKTIVAILAVVHLVLFPAVIFGMSTVMHKLVRAPIHDEPMSLPDAGPDSKAHAILINPPKALFVGYFPNSRRYYGYHNPASLQALASGDQDLTYTVLDERSLRLKAPQGLGEPLLRDFLRFPFKAGDEVRAGRFQVVVEEVTPLGKPSQVRFHFDTPLSDAQWELYVWGDDGYERFKMPPPGQTFTLPKVDMGKFVGKRFKASF